MGKVNFVPASKRRGKKQLHPLSSDSDYKPHSLDDYIQERLERQSTVPNEAYDENFSFDPCFDGQEGVFYMRWTDDDIEQFLEGHLEYSLRLLRDSSTGSGTYTRELEWVCSQQFETYCRAFGKDANLIRLEIAHIAKKQGRELSDTAAALMKAILRLPEVLSFDLTPIEYNAQW
ncbi:hypothetical protein IC617_08025 [Neiella sp. HB171785]|uniref:Uncharacterized protein n=1 Tax=Neiella litorisoli TaxID=2771431 RepID=A0A8J6ULQ3_9GAMM|nr:hypothetical protein [Neiella litorisoli]MBD1389370.1 hypothetical protein [Neiella litorisoli]